MTPTILFAGQGFSILFFECFTPKGPGEPLCLHLSRGDSIPVTKRKLEDSLVSQVRKVVGFSSVFWPRPIFVLPDCVLTGGTRVDQGTRRLGGIPFTVEVVAPGGIFGVFRIPSFCINRTPHRLGLSFIEKANHLQVELRTLIPNFLPRPVRFPDLLQHQ